MKRLSSRFHLAFGLASLLMSVLLLSIYLGLVPDRDHAIRTSRAVLAETVAVSSSALLDRGDAGGLAEMLGFILQRNPEILSAGVRTARGELAVDQRGHAAHWRVGSETHSVETQIQVPIWQGKQRWGSLELRFRPIGAAGWRGVVFDPRVKLTAFVVLAAFVVFYFYLRRMLRHLDPSRAVPARVRAALDTLAEGLLVLDPKGFVVLANRAFAEVAGATSEALVGKPAAELGWCGADGRGIEADVLPWAATRDGETQRNRTVYLSNAQGERRTFRVNCTPVLGEGVKDTPVLVSLDDVTEIEEKETELVAARHKAESANQLKSDFLANMSHEIRTPMNAVLGFTELLRRGYQRNNVDVRKHLDTIHSSGRHLLDLINDILDLSKVEAGRIEVERIDCSPWSVLREVVQILGVKAAEKGIGLELVPAGALPERICSDPARLRQIVTNLVGNAIKFTEQGAVRVRARLHDDGGEPQFVIEVADSGIGIPADKLDAIFDPFTQAESSTTRRFGGTGLGLTISRRFARALGGDVTVTSEVGTGSVFTIAVATGPLAGVALLDAAALAAMSEQASLAAQARWTFPRSQVLVVDDGAENRELVRLVLEEAGIEVTEADNGRTALDLIAQKPFAAVLMDVQMPVMDGFAATRALRAQGCALPVIALTAHAMKGFEREIAAAGFSGYLTKPIDIDAMLADLGARLGAERSAVLEPIQPDARPTPAAAGEPIVSRLANHARLRRVVIRFSEQLQHKLAAMDAAWDRRDLTALADLAHWLKGSGGTVGYDAFFEPARALEQMAKDATESGIGPLLAELHAMAARLVVPDDTAAANAPAAEALRSA